MNIVRISLLAGLCACTVRAAELPRPAGDASGITILLGQWKFLHSSVALCSEKVPALKKELGDARARAEVQIRKAQALILDEIGDDRDAYKRHVDLYVQMWSKQADDMAEAMKLQDPAKACPVLLGNWQAMAADVIVEDWDNFLDRTSFEPEEAAAEKGKETPR